MKILIIIIREWVHAIKITGPGDLKMWAWDGCYPIWKLLGKYFVNNNIDFVTQSDYRMHIVVCTYILLFYINLPRTFQVPSFPDRHNDSDVYLIVMKTRSYRTVVSLKHYFFCPLSIDDWLIHSQAICLLHKIFLFQIFLRKILCYLSLSIWCKW